MFAPHTRGSTATEPGSDAMRESLPRTRGGLPIRSHAMSARAAFAPHTRGSTDQIPRYERQGGVCPAHAGVYRSR